IFEEVLRTWSKKINIVSRETLSEVWKRHFWDSYQLSLYIDNKEKSIIDLGSGAGFPGLILSIAGYSNVSLVERNGRKSSFLRYAACQLGVAPFIRTVSIESIKGEKYDYITARACAPLVRLLNLSLNFTGPESQCIFLKGERWH